MRMRKFKNQASTNKAAYDIGTPKNAKKKQGAAGGYLDAIACQEANLISMTSLEEGEAFEKDINNIIEIIDGVEKNMCRDKLNN